MEKGKYKNTPTDMRPSEKRKDKGRPKIPPRRFKYKRRRVKQKCDWGSLYQWMPLLDPYFSNHFTFNYNQCDCYIDAVLHKIDPVPDNHIIES